MAANEGLDLRAIDGSGPHGRIVKADIERALKDGTGKAQCRQGCSARQAGAPPQLPSRTGRVVEEIPLTNMRKVIARRLTEAKQTIPHFYLTMDCELDALLALQKAAERPRGRGLQTLGQRLRDQGGSTRAEEGADGQRVLRRRQAPYATGHRYLGRGRHSRWLDHADHPGKRIERGSARSRKR